MSLLEIAALLSIGASIVLWVLSAWARRGRQVQGSSQTANASPPTTAGGGATGNPPAAATNQPAATTPPAPATTHNTHHHAPSQSASNEWAGFCGAVITLGAVLLGIYWGIQKINQGIPEKLEFSGYYHFQEKNLDGSNTGLGGQVLVRVTPHSINYGFASTLGGNVSGRWTRNGEGTWTRVFGSNAVGSWLHIINATGSPMDDYKEWQTKIVAEVGDDTDPNKYARMVLLR